MSLNTLIITASGLLVIAIIVLIIVLKVVRIKNEYHFVKENFMALKKYKEYNEKHCKPHETCCKYCGSLYEKTLDRCPTCGTKNMG